MQEEKHKQQAAATQIVANVGTSWQLCRKRETVQKLRLLWVVGWKISRWSTLSNLKDSPITRCSWKRDSVSFSQTPNLNVQIREGSVVICTHHKNSQNGCWMRNKTPRNGLCLLRRFSGWILGCWLAAHESWSLPKKYKNPKKGTFLGVSFHPQNWQKSNRSVPCTETGPNEASKQTTGRWHNKKKQKGGLKLVLAD